MRQNGISINAVGAGSGPGGRIIAEDVTNALKRGVTAGMSMTVCHLISVHCLMSDMPAPAPIKAAPPAVAATASAPVKAAPASVAASTSAGFTRLPAFFPI